MARWEEPRECENGCGFETDWPPSMARHEGSCIKAADGRDSVKKAPDALTAGDVTEAYEDLSTITFYAVVLTIPSGLRARLDALAFAQGKSIDVVVRELIEEATVGDELEALGAALVAYRESIVDEDAEAEE